jgi:hypothetical protein
MKLNPHDKEMAEADRERIFHGDVFREFPEHHHPALPPMFSDRFKTFLYTGLIMGAVFTVIYYWNIK